MDRKITFSIALALLSSLSVLLYRKVFYKHEGINYFITPKGDLKVNDTLTFRDETNGANRWVWDFGDGEFSKDRAGTHAYMQPGRYDVKLSVFGSFGTLQKSSGITVTGTLPAATTEIIGLETVKTGQQTGYDVSGNAASYEWTVTGDAALANDKQTGKSALYTFDKPGVRTLVLTMQNPNQVIRKTIRVEDAAPAVAAAPRPVTPAKPHPAGRHQGHRHTDNGAAEALPDVSPVIYKK